MHSFSVKAGSRILMRLPKILRRKAANDGRVANPSASSTSKKPRITRPKGAKYRTLLAIDGGGVRGMIPVMVLKHLETSIKTHIFDHKDTLIPEDARKHVHSAGDFDIDLTDYFDLVAGTSIGSWIACYVASRGRGSQNFCNDSKTIAKFGHLRPGSMEVCRAMCLTYSSQVFPPGGIFRSIRRIFFPEYPVDGLKTTLKEFFDETTMDDMETSCLIPSYDLERSAPCSFLHDPNSKPQNFTVRAKVRTSTRTLIEPGTSPVSFPQEFSRAFAFDHFYPDLVVIPDTNYHLRDITQASSSAPTYFRPARISPLNAKKDKPFVLIDGGVIANNPSLQALTYVPNTFSSGNIDDVAIFSVGCGSVDLGDPKVYQPGLLWWMASGYLIDAFTKGVGEYIQSVVDFWFHQYLQRPPGQYVRIQITAPRDTPLGKILASMDNADNVPALQKIGSELAQKNDDEIKAFVEKYIFGSS